MLSISDNLAHMCQLALILGTMTLLMIFVHTIPSEVILAAFVPTATALIGAKITQSATNAANAPAQPVQVTSLHAPTPVASEPGVPQV